VYIVLIVLKFTPFKPLILNYYSILLYTFWDAVLHILHSCSTHFGTST